MQKQLTPDQKAQIATCNKFEKMIGKNTAYYCYKFVSGKWACATFDSPNGRALYNSGGIEIDMGIKVVFCVAIRPN